MRGNLHYHYLVGYIPNPRTAKYSIVKQVFVDSDNFRNDKMQLPLKNFQKQIKYLNTLHKPNVTYEYIDTWCFDEHRLWDYKSLAEFMKLERCKDALTPVHNLPQYVKITNNLLSNLSY